MIFRTKVRGAPNFTILTAFLQITDSKRLTSNTAINKLKTVTQKQQNNRFSPPKQAKKPSHLGGLTLSSHHDALIIPPIWPHHHVEMTSSNRRSVHFPAPFHPVVFYFTDYSESIFVKKENHSASSLTQGHRGTVKASPCRVYRVSRLV